MICISMDAGQCVTISLVPSPPTQSGNGASDWYEHDEHSNKAESYTSEGNRFENRAYRTVCTGK